VYRHRGEQGLKEVAMPLTTIRGVHINYEVLGSSGPWVVLTPGGRSELAGVRVLGERLAAAGHRVLLHDRRNCGASDVVIGGEASEQEIWADDLYELMGQLGARPAYVGGNSAGCRLSLLLALRHRDAVRGLLLWQVTGGQYAADSLGYNYYTQFIEAAERGGMAAVCDSDFFRARIAANPANRDRLIAMTPADFIAVMTRWREFFTAGADLPVIGATEADLRSITVPTSIVPGTDQTHPQAVGENLHRLLPDSELHYIYTDAEVAALADRPIEEVRNERQERVAPIFTAFLARQAAAVR
jgi:pimeloyl-ACP methyl ester carboxylesterase